MSRRLDARRGWLIVLWAVWAFVSVVSLALVFFGSAVLWPTLIAAAVLLGARPSWRVVVAVLLLSTLPATAFLTYSNWGGPGYVCHDVPNGEVCADAGSPIPWLAGLAALTAIPSVLLWRHWLLRHRRPPDLGTGAPSREPLGEPAGEAARVMHWLDEVVLPATWHDLRGHDVNDQQRREHLAAELRRELGVDHQLTGKGWRVVAAATARDDALLALPDGTAALVHLTYASTAPERPPWPMTTVLSSKRDLEDELLQRD